MFGTMAYCTNCLLRNMCRVSFCVGSLLSCEAAPYVWYVVLLARTGIPLSVECLKVRSLVQGLFLVYVDDLPAIVRFTCCLIDLLADDATLYPKICGPDGHANFSMALNEIYAWSVRWQQVWSPDKSRIVVFHNKRKSPVVPDFSIRRGSILQVDNSHKYLGISFQRSLRWLDHAAALLSKAFVCLFVCLSLNELRYRNNCETLQNGNLGNTHSTTLHDLLYMS